MTIKLLQLKSGDDIIANVEEMSVGEDAEKRIIGYYFAMFALMHHIKKPQLRY